jgi:hypothetical protein
MLIYIFGGLCRKNGFQFYPPTLTGLNLGLSKASKSEFQGVINEVSFFHSTQCIGQRIQMSELDTAMETAAKPPILKCIICVHWHYFHLVKFQELLMNYNHISLKETMKLLTGSK